jgi:hypothetical protein
MQQKCHLLEQQACFPSSESDQWNRKVRWTQGKSQIAPLCPKRYSRLSFLNARIWYKLKASVCSHTKNIGFKIHGKPQKYWDGIFSVHFGVTRKDSHSLYCYCWQSETAPCFGGGGVETTCSLQCGGTLADSDFFPPPPSNILVQLSPF